MDGDDAHCDVESVNKTTSASCAVFVSEGDIPGDVDGNADDDVHGNAEINIADPHFLAMLNMLCHVIFMFENDFDCDCYLSEVEEDAGGGPNIMADDDAHSARERVNETTSAGCAVFAQEGYIPGEVDGNADDDVHCNTKESLAAPRLLFMLNMLCHVIFMFECDFDCHCYPDEVEEDSGCEPNSIPVTTPTVLWKEVIRRPQQVALFLLRKVISQVT